MWVFAGALLLVILLIAERGRDLLRPAAAATGLGAAFLCVEPALIQRFSLAAGGALYAVSFVLFSLLAWSATGALIFGRVWRRFDRGLSAACVAAAVAVALTSLLVRDLQWLDAISSDSVRLLLVALLLAPAGLAIGCPFPGLLEQPGSRIASLWAVNGAASVAGGIISVLALRVGGTTHALLLAAALYVATAAVAPRVRM